MEALAHSLAMAVESASYAYRYAALMGWLECLTCMATFAGLGVTVSVLLYKDSGRQRTYRE